jgi:hypothetical protein
VLRYNIYHKFLIPTVSGIYEDTLRNCALPKGDKHDVSALEKKLDEWFDTYDKYRELYDAAKSA